MTRTRIALSLLAALPLALSVEAAPVKQVNQTFDLPATFAATIQTSACSTLPGPQVQLQGTLTPAPLDIDVIFSHVQGAPDPQASVAVSRDVVPQDAPVISPSQSVQSAMGGNPYLWLQLTDSKGRALTSEIFLGRCDEGTFSPTIELVVPSKALADVSATSCEVASGPVVGFDGQVEMSPLHANLIFRSSPTSPNKPQAEIELVILPTGPAFQFPQTDVQAGVGGNPLISTQFRLEGGAAIGNENSLGRCKAIEN